MARLKIGNIKGPTGATGQNGVSITGIELKETSTNGSKVYNLILSNGNKLEFTAPIGPIGNTGPKGEQGVQGVQGVGIKSIVYKNNDSSGGNVYTITLTNNNTYEFTAPKGAKGDRGEKGEPGESTAVSLRWDDILEKPSSFPSAWGSVAGKPSSFTPSAHNHAWSEITGKPTVFPTSWSNVSGKPATFPPDSHTHPYLSTSGGTVNGNLTVTGEFLANGDVTAFSDRELKENIKPLKENFIDDLQVYSYNYIGEKDIRYGVIAQELQEFYPNLVLETDREVNGRKVLAVRDRDIIYLLLDAYQKLSKRVSELERGE